jgi:hypothetical protein
VGAGVTSEAFERDRIELRRPTTGPLRNSPFQTCLMAIRLRQLNHMRIEAESWCASMFIRRFRKNQVGQHAAL